VVLPDGRAIRAGRPVVKNVAGYDITKLFVGAWGTLGLVTDVSLKLAPLPRTRSSLLVPFDSLADGLACGQRLLGVCLVASALLLCNGSALREARAPDMKADTCLIYTAEGIREDVAAELEEARTVLRKCGASGVRLVDGESGSEIWASWLAEADANTGLRAGVPPKDLSRLVTALTPMLSGATWIADIASGLLYARGAALAPVRKSALSHGGYAVSFSGGAGDRWGYAPEGLPWMQALKARWDRGTLFNPGVFIV
jgi:D-lactate dehydrogenase (cytochrome)